MNLPDGPKKQWLVLLLVAAAALVIIFNLPAFMPDGDHASAPFLNPSQMLFDNDNPLGAQMAEQNKLPGTIFGMWGNLNWVGGEGVGDSPRITNLTAAILHPILFVKYYPFLSLLFVAFAAWLYFRQLKLNPMVCLFGGLAAAVNMHFFSCAVWGVFLWNIAAGCIFLALAALASERIKQGWAKAALAGFAVGMAVMEGFDSGAILSMLFGAFMIFAGWYLSDEPAPRRLVKTAVTSVLVVGFSVFIAFYTLTTLVTTQIKPDTQQTSSKTQTPEEIQRAQEEKARRWSFSTQWSLPKLETLRLFIPGLMGYHMYENVDGPDKSSAYWGRIGEALDLTAIRDLRSSPDPEVRRQADEAMRTYNTGYRRHIGSGDYAGLLVMILAGFAVVNTFRRSNGPFSVKEKRLIWFWAVAALISLILAFGRHAFLYKYLFELPYFSNTRNPIKFLHPFYVCILILAALGAEAVWRNYLRGPVRAFGTFEKRWTMFWVGVIVVSVFGLFVLVSKKSDLVHYLTLNGVVPGTETQLATFCIAEVVWYVLFLIASVGLLTLVIRGTWTGKQVKWAWIFMCALLVWDVGRADRWWLKYYNYKEKYALNPVLDFLSKEPYDKKSTAKLTPYGHYDISASPVAPRKPYDNNFYAVCNEWLQNQFPYYNIQALDIVQAPRTPEMDEKMAMEFTPRSVAELPLAARLWQLTNTRYVFCWAGYLERPLFPNPGCPTLQGLDPSGNAFQIRTRLNVVPGPGVIQPTTSADLSMEPANDGDFALVEYTNALPRVKLYSNWQSGDSDDATLNTLKSPAFDPQKSVIVAKETAVAAKPSVSADAGTVKIEDYHPKYIKMQANANAGDVLLFNERWSANWHVFVDNKEMPLLRCNYLMKGVYLDKGQHTVEFKFSQPLGSLYVTLAGWGAAILLGAFVIATNYRKEEKFDPADGATSKEKSTTQRV